MIFRSKPCRDETVEDAMKLDMPRYIGLGILCLFLLKQTINDYRAAGLDNIWTVISGIGFLIAVASFFALFPGRRPESRYTLTED